MFSDLKTKLVFSLKSSSIELSVIDLSEKPKLLFAKKESLLYKEALSPKDFIDKTLESIQKLIRKNLVEITKYLKNGSDCEIILYSPWYLPELISEENKGKKISLKSFFMDKVKPPKQKDYQQIENKITNILLNGYKLTKLRDIESDDIEINLYRSFASKSTIEKIEKNIKKEIRQISNFDFSTSSMQIYESIKSLFYSEDNFVYIYIGGEVTEIGVSENDVLVFESSIPIGTHIFSRGLDTFISEKGNLSTLNFLSSSVTDEKLDKKRDEKIELLKNKWIKDVLNSLKSKEGELPRKTFIFTNSDALEFMKMILNKCEECEKMDFFAINNEIFNNKVENLVKNTNKNVEYLLSTYYLSIKN